MVDACTSLASTFYIMRNIFLRFSVCFEDFFVLFYPFYYFSVYLKIFVAGDLIIYSLLYLPIYLFFIPSTSSFPIYLCV
jgi:hypothetical protein